MAALRGRNASGSADVGDVPAVVSISGLCDHMEQMFWTLEY